MSYKAEKSVSLIKKGSYESVIEKMELKPAKNETRTLAITYRIRDDIEQESQNRLVFENIWLGSQFHQKRIENLLYAVNSPKDKVFNSVEEVMGYCQGKKVIINVDIYFDEFYNDERNKVSFVKQTAHPDKKLDTTVEVNDEELPF